MSGHKRTRFCPDMIVTTRFGYKHVWAQSCVGTNVSGHKRVWAQTCLGTIVCGHKRVWAQSCLGTNVCGHKRVWAQSCVGAIVCGHNRVGSIMYGPNRVVSVSIVWASRIAGGRCCFHCFGQYMYVSNSVNTLTTNWYTCVPRVAYLMKYCVTLSHRVSIVIINL